MFKKEKYLNSEKIGKYGLSLPTDPNLKKNELNKIVNTINSF